MQYLYCRRSWWRKVHHPWDNQLAKELEGQDVPMHEVVDEGAVRAVRGSEKDPWRKLMSK